MDHDDGSSQAVQGTHHAAQARRVELVHEKAPEDTVDEAHSSHESDSSSDVTYPEGGRAAWSVVLGSWLASFGSVSFMNSIGTFQAYLIRNQLRDSSSTSVGWIFGVFTGLTFLLGILVGPIFDARGPHELICLGGAATVLYLMLLSVCSEYWQFMLVFGLIGGISLSLVLGPSLSIVGHYFHKRRGFATGIASSGGAVGGIVFSLMLQKLSATVGFAWAVRAVAFVCLTTFTIAILLLRHRLPTRPLTFSSVRPDLSAFRNGAFVFTSAGVFFLEWGLFIPFSYITSFALDHQQDADFSYMLISLLNAGGILGRWIPAYYADRLGRFNMLIIVVAGCGISSVCLWLPAGSSQALMVTYALMFGFFGGSTVSLAPVCVGQLCKIESYGSWYATAFVVVSMRLVTPLPATSLYTHAN